jgi:multicomponent Na+:H+ antiporter subunit F
MVVTVIWICTGLLLLLTFVGFYRAIKGPTAFDRIVALNMITTKITSMIVLVALATAQDNFVSVSLVYALIGFVASIGLVKLLMKGRLE